MKAREEAGSPARRPLWEFSRDLEKDEVLMAVGRVGSTFYLGAQ